MGFFDKLKKKEEVPSPPSIKPTKLPESPDELPSFKGEPEFEIPRPPSKPEEKPAMPLPEMKEESIPFPKEKPSPMETPQPETQPEIPKPIPEVKPEAPPKPDIKPSFSDALTAKYFAQQKEEIEEAKEHEEVDVAKPIFVQVSQYKELLAEITESVNALKNSEDILQKLNELKTNGDKQLEKWRLSFEDIQRKLIFIDKTLFEKVM